MTTQHILAFVALCFGVGLGFSSIESTAHACSCGVTPFLKLQRVGVEGDGDLAVEQQYWQDEMWLYDDGQFGTTQFNEGLALELERLP